MLIVPESGYLHKVNIQVRSFNSVLIPGGGGDSHIKVTGVLVVPFRVFSVKRLQL